MNDDKKALDLADFLAVGGDFEEALAAAVPMAPREEDGPPPPEEGYWEGLDATFDAEHTPGRDKLAAAREVIRDALVALGAEQTTREDRGRAAVRLAAAVPDLAALAHAAPQEWATACLGLGACGGFGGHLERLDRAVKRSADVLAQEAKAAQRERTKATARRAAPDRAVMSGLSLNERGTPKATYANLCRVFGQDPRWASLRMNAYGEDVEKDGETWPEAVGTAEAAMWLSDVYEIDGTEGSIKSAIHATASGRVHNPVTEYLDSVRGKADGSIARLLPEVLGITDGTDLHRAMLGRWLISCVARARHPGVKADAMLVLVGKQGRKKSTFFATLAGDWFGDSELEIGSKEAPIVFSRFWIQELAELDGITSAREVTVIKRFASIKKDTYRAPYARAAAEHPRRTAFCGSVNEGQFLTDSTGNRRFFCLTVPDGWTIPIALLASLRDAVWAEAQDLYEEGERWWFEPHEDEVREEDAQQYMDEDPWQAIIEGWLDGMGSTSPFTSTRVLEVGLKLDAAQINRVARRRVVAILRRLGYTERVSPAGFRGSRVWSK